MKIPSIALNVLALLTFSIGANAKVPKLSFDSKKGEISISNKNVLIVNIATRCGYTPQLTALEKLYKKYQDKGLIVVGVPSNEFGSQSPEDDAGIEKFCKLNYGVTFPLSKKTIVLGKDKNRVFKYLLEKTNKAEIKWNFEKFLISSSGSVERFSSSVSPDSKQLAEAIEKALK
jgi:glutathione peroxidase